MDKVFTSIEDQIKILKSRGLVIDDEPAVKSILSKENYYNLINGYKSLFLDSSAETETFLEGTTFSEIYELYLFDRELRSIFMRCILEIENNVKSVLAYKFSEQYSHTNYLVISNSNTYIGKHENKTLSQKTGEIVDLITGIQREISHQLGKNSLMISHYVLDHGYVPFWVLVNTLSLGTISTFYSHLKDKDENNIGREFGLKPDVMKNILYILTIFRNGCAHDERFYNLKSLKRNEKPNSIADTDIHSFLRIPKNSSNNYLYGKNDLFAIVIIFRLLLSGTSFTRFFGRLVECIGDLDGKLKVITIDDELNEMGFPPNWTDIINYNS